MTSGNRRKRNDKVSGVGFHAFGWLGTRLQGALVGLVAGDKPFFAENPAAPVRAWSRKALEEGELSGLSALPNDVAWMNHDYGTPPFCVGSRAYIRSRAFLYCIGEQKQP